MKSENADAEASQRIVTDEQGHHFASFKPRRKRRVAAHAPDDSRPTIKIVHGEIERVVDEAEGALIRAKRGLYQRDGKIVFLADSLGMTASGRQVIAQRIVERGDHALLEDLGCAARFIKFDKRDRRDVAIGPPLWVAKTLRERVGRFRFDVLEGFTHAPTLRPDGSVLSTPGYDAGTGLLYDPLGVEFPAIPENPTRAEAEAAFALLSDLISTFPFVSEVDHAVALSAIVSALVRRSLRTAPLHAFTAPVAGTGKSMLVDLASVIATGHEAAVIARTSSDEELEKRLGAELLAGNPIIAIDNCERALGGEVLCQMLTQTRVRTRVLGQSVTPEMISGAFIAATGNNLALVGDITRRALLCTIDAKVERPEARSFDRDALAMAKSRRPQYVASVLTILRAFHVAGRPKIPTPLGSFEEWSNLVRGALLWLGCADPVESVDAVRDSDPRRRELATVVSHWRDVVGGEKVTVADVIEIVSERTAAESAFQRPEFREALLNVAGTKGDINSRVLGHWLSSQAGKVVGRLRFERVGERSNVTLWRLSEL